MFFSITSSGAPAVAWQKRIWSSGSGAFHFAPPGLSGCAVCVHLSFSGEEKKTSCDACFLVTWWPWIAELVEANRMQMLLVWEKWTWKSRKERQWKDVGVGDNKLFANQTTMSADARLEWMPQARLFQPDCWSMWAHIFSAMGEETVMTKPMSLPFVFSPLWFLPAPLLCSCPRFCLACARFCLFLSFPHIAGNMVTLFTLFFYLFVFVL